MYKLLIELLILTTAVSGVLVDLSHPMDENSRNWPIEGFKRYNLTTLTILDTEEGFVIAKDIEMTEHLGTHMDAPHHFGKTSWTVAQIPIENFIVPVVKIDVRDKCAQNRDYELSVEDLRDWEEKNGAVPDNAVVLMETGWGDKYSNSEAYLGTDRDIAASDFNYTLWVQEIHYPGFSAALATELLNYNIAGVGIDTPSLDPGIVAPFPVHFILQGNNKWGLENLCCLELVPSRGATLFAIPPKVVGGSGFPTRVLVDTDSTFALKFSSGSTLGLNEIVALSVLILVF